MILFVSPHLDDIALSCGGLASRLAANGESVIVATACTADAPAGGPLSPAAQHEHWQWQLGDQPYIHRRAEDERACNVLGVQPVHLGLLDAIYRRDESGAPLYTSDFIGGDVHPLDWQSLFTEVKTALVLLVQSASRTYSPLAIGGHVDHVVVRRAVEILAEPSRLHYYEDFPYAGKVDQPERAFGLTSEHVTLTEDEIEARMGAITCYPSQMLALFGSAEAMPERVRAYLARTGGERYWRPA